jgi:hypothetical protein
MYVDGVTVLAGNCGCGSGVVGTGTAVAARDTCEREPVDGVSAQSDNDDCEASAEESFFSD